MQFYVVAKNKFTEKCYLRKIVICGYMKDKILKYKVLYRHTENIERVFAEFLTFMPHVLLEAFGSWLSEGETVGSPITKDSCSQRADSNKAPGCYPSHVDGDLQRLRLDQGQEELTGRTLSLPVHSVVFPEHLLCASASAGHQRHTRESTRCMSSSQVAQGQWVEKLSEIITWMKCPQRKEHIHGPPSPLQGKPGKWL